MQLFLLNFKIIFISIFHWKIEEKKKKNSRGEDPVFARFGSGALNLERREIFEILLIEYFLEF